MASEAIGFWNRFYNFFTTDDEARWKAITWAIMLGGTVGAVSLSLGDASVDEAVMNMVAVLILFGFLWVSAYCLVGRSESRSQLHAPIWAVSVVISTGVVLAAFIVFLSTRIGSLQQVIAVAAENPTSPTNQIAAKEVFVRVQNQPLKLSTEIIERGGASFIEASKEDQQAWPVALEFLNYRTQLAFEEIKNETWVLIEDNSRRQLASELGFDDLEKKFAGVTQYYSQSLTDLSDSALMSPIGAELVLRQAIRSIAPKELTQFPKYFRMVGRRYATVPAIDGGYFHNVVFENVTVQYHGGPVILENVFFINCRFRLPNTRTTHTFAAKALGSDGVTYRSDS